MMPRTPRGRLEAYEQRRKSWAGIPIIGGLIELLKNLIYRREAARVAKRIPHRQNLALLERAGRNLTVRMDLRRGNRRAVRQSRLQEERRRAA
jgi:hypothetical protein